MVGVDIFVKSKSDETVDIKFRSSENPLVDAVVNTVEKQLGQRGDIEVDEGASFAMRDHVLGAGTYYWVLSRTSPPKHNSDDILLEQSLAKKQRIDAPVEQDGVVELNVQNNDLLAPKGHSKVRYSQRNGIKELHDWLLNPVDSDEGKYWNVSLIGHPDAGKSNMMWWIAQDLVTTKSDIVLWLGRRQTSDDWSAYLFENDTASTSPGGLFCSEIAKLPASVEVGNLMKHEKMSSVSVLILDAPTVSKTATEASAMRHFSGPWKRMVAVLSTYSEIMYENRKSRGSAWRTAGCGAASYLMLVVAALFSLLVGSTSAFSAGLDGHNGMSPWMKQRVSRMQQNMCICIDCSRVTNCQAYHFVETKHSQPHMSEDPVRRRPNHVIVLI